MSETAQGKFASPDPAMATALAQAEEAQAKASNAVRAGSTWTSQFLCAFGVTSVVFISLTAVGGVLAYATSWVVYGVIATWFARRERVSWRGFDRLSGTSLTASIVLQGAGCAVGFNFFSGVAAYWVPFALVACAPLFIGAWRAANR